MNKILVTRSSIPSFEEYCAEIESIFESHWLTNNGEKHQQLEGLLSDYLSVKNVVLFTNGHLALEGALAGLDLPRGGEVITTPFTFASTTHAIVRNGLKPVFCDIKEDDYTIDPALIESLITDKTVAIVPVHVYGNLCDVDAIQEIATRYGLKVVYDAAHAFGVTKNGVGAASYGDASMLSFHATKVFNTIEGGAVCFSNDAWVKTLNNLKNFGIIDEETVEYVGGNAKMNEFQAAMGICNLRHVDAEIAKRKLVVERYRERLEGLRRVVLSAPQDGVASNYAYFPVRFCADGTSALRDAVCEGLKKDDVFARKYFYPITNRFSCYPNAYDEYPTPVALRVSNEIATLPLYADLSLQDVDRICDTIAAVCKDA